MNQFPAVNIFDYSLQSCSMDEAVAWCLEAAQQSDPKLLVTLNPEIIIQSQTDDALKSALQAADFTVADGIGVLWATRVLAEPLPERIPGVELMMNVLEKGGEELSVFFLGSKQGVAKAASEIAHERFGTHIAGEHHGYFDKEADAEEIAAIVKASGAQLLLAGLGEGQELFLHRNRQALGVPLMIGVGGSLDVLSGSVQRTPDWTLHLGVEWAYRVGMDRKRWNRFPRLLQFIQLVKDQKKSDTYSSLVWQGVQAMRSSR